MIASSAFCSCAVDPISAVNVMRAKGQARMTFTAEIGSTQQLHKALLAIMEVNGVQQARRQ